MKQCIKCRKEYNHPTEPCPGDGGHHKPDLLIDTIIDDKYQIQRCIGRGGMGAVYVAQHTKFTKRVAVKVLLQGLVETHPDALMRFRREAEASARIKHPNAVPVTDFGQTDEGLYYLVMDYIEGRTLRNVLESEKRFSPSRAVYFANQICAAIGAAHNAGVYHRDLKPDNVIVEKIDNREIAKVLDFGIAKLGDSQQTNITDTGALLGTPNYMSPEQCTSSEVDHRIDIYSLGVMLYQMLVGDLPFRAANAAGVILMHVSQAPKPLRAHNPNIPEALEYVVLRALEKDPRKRQASVMELAEQLEAAVNPNANQWRVNFHGLTDNSNPSRRQFAENIQKTFGLSPKQIEQLLAAPSVSVKKTPSKEEAEKIANALHSFGAIVRVESIIGEYDKAALNASGVGTLNVTTGFATNTTVADPLLETDNYEMLRKVKTSTTGELAELESATTDIGDGEEATQLSPGTNRVVDATNNNISKTVVSAKNSTDHISGVTVADGDGWSLEVEGEIYNNITDAQLDLWIREGRISKTDKLKKGNLQWREISTIPGFRRSFEAAAKTPTPNTAHNSSGASQTNTVTDAAKDENRVFIKRVAKWAAAAFIGYTLVSYIFIYYQYLQVKDGIYYIFMTNTTNVTNIKKQMQDVVLEHNLTVPNDDIHITLDYPNQQAAVSLKYQRRLLFIPLTYTVKRDYTRLKITMDHLASLKKEDNIELVGITDAAIQRYKIEKAEKEAAAAANGGYVPDRPLNERDALILKLQDCANGNCDKTGIVIDAARSAQ